MRARGPNHTSSPASDDPWRKPRSVSELDHSKVKADKKGFGGILRPPGSRVQLLDFLVGLDASIHRDPSML